MNVIVYVTVHCAPFGAAYGIRIRYDKRDQLFSLCTVSMLSPYNTTTWKTRFSCYSSVVAISVVKDLFLLPQKQWYARWTPRNWSRQPLPLLWYSISLSVLSYVINGMLQPKKCGKSLRESSFLSKTNSSPPHKTEYANICIKIQEAVLRTI